MASKLLDQVRDAIRLRHYSIRTERTYLYWIRYFIRYHGMRHPRSLDESAVRDFLSFLALDRKVAAATQKVALNALSFLYFQVLGRQAMNFAGFRPASRERKLPVVLTRPELEAIFACLSGEPRLCARLMYGSGLRVMEVVRLRVHDIDRERLSLLVRDGKGRRQRITTLAESLLPEIDHQLDGARWFYDEDANLAEWPGVALPDALARKYPNAPREWGWQWLFPAARPGIRAAEFGAVIICTSAACSGRLLPRCARPGSASRPRAIRCATHSPLICWSAVPTSVRFRSSSGTRMCAPRRSTPTSSIAAAAGS